MFKKTINRIAYIVLFVILLNNVSKSQNETGTRYVVSNLVGGSMWYDSNSAMFQKHYPIIRNLPPLNTGMPYDILLSYIYLDSLLKNTNKHQTDSVIKSWTSMNGNLANTLKYLYKIVDYNPIIFRQYTNEVSLNRKNLFPMIPYIYIEHVDSITGEFNGIVDTVAVDTSHAHDGTYTNHLIDIILKITSKIWNLAENNNVGPYSKTAYWSGLYSDHIFKIKVLSIDSTKNKNTPLNYKRYNVTAQVLDTIKGKVYVPYTIPANFNKKINNIQDYTNFPLIQFQYTPINYFDSSEDSNHGEEKISDSLFQNYKGDFKMNINQEAVVFLKHCNYLIDNQNDYYDLDLEPTCSNNALPIINGQIRDLNHYWSNSDYVDYLSWRNLYIQLKNQILNMEY